MWFANQSSPMLAADETWWAERPPRPWGQQQVVVLEKTDQFAVQRRARTLGPSDCFRIRPRPELELLDHIGPKPMGKRNG